MGINQDLSNDMGSKVSQMEKDVRTAADQDLLYSSSWPVLRTVRYGRSTTSVIQDGTVEVANCFDHNLGYTPLFITFSANAYNGEFSRERLLLYVNDESAAIIVPPAAPGTTLTFDFYYFLFAVDITENYTSNVFKTTTRNATKDNDFGIKVSLRDRDINSTDLRDFSIHSGTRSPMVHSINYGQPSGTSFITTHTLPYKPLFYSYLNTGAEYLGKTNWFVNVNNFAATVATDSSIVLEGLLSTYYCSTVILKDPFEVGNIQAVSI